MSPRNNDLNIWIKYNRFQLQAFTVWRKNHNRFLNVESLFPLLYLIISPFLSDTNCAESKSSCIQLATNKQSELLFASNMFCCFFLFCFFTPAPPLASLSILRRFSSLYATHSWRCGTWHQKQAHLTLFMGARDRSDKCGISLSLV